MNNAAERIYERLLVVRCQLGDAAALKELIAQYSPRLRFFLRKIAGDASADDLLQDVWIDVFADIARLKDAGAFTAWVYRIARHKAYAQANRRHRPTLQLDDLPAGACDEAEPWESAEDAALVRAGLDALPAEQREVLVLRFVEDMSYEQIATVIARPAGTVRSRIHYAKQALRTFIERHHVTERT
jgi:RNA polymerase sigma-70 factor (ECF subfamily)